MRFELRDFIVWILFLGSAIGCILNSDRWEVFKAIPNNGKPILDASFSPDDKFIAVITYDSTLKLYKFPELKLIWETNAPPESTKDNIWSLTLLIGFSENSQNVALWARQGLTDSTVYLFQLDSGRELPSVNKHKAFNMGEPLPGSYQIFKGETTGFALPPEFTQSILSSTHEFMIYPPKLTGFSKSVYRARYPEQWYGHFYRPEVWGCLLFGLVLMVRIIQIRRRRPA